CAYMSTRMTCHADSNSKTHGQNLLSNSCGNESRSQTPGYAKYCDPRSVAYTAHILESASGTGDFRPIARNWSQTSEQLVHCDPSPHNTLHRSGGQRPM